MMQTVQQGPVSSAVVSKQHELVQNFISFRKSVLKQSMFSIQRSRKLLSRKNGCTLHTQIRFLSAAITDVVSNKIGNGMTHYCKDNTDKTDKTDKTVVVITGWLWSKQSQLKPYVKYYAGHGMDVLTITVSPRHILVPDQGLKQMEDVISAATKLNPKNVIFHQFSTGGYLYGQLLRAISGEKSASGKSKEHYEQFQKAIKGQIFDSPPDMHGIAHGISKGFQSNKFVELLVENTLKLYLRLVHNYAGVEHRASSNIFHNNIVRAPSLWFYSKSDKIAPWKDCKKVIDTWKNRNIEVEECIWEQSPHIQHGRLDPERYFGNIDSFLKKNQLI